MSTTESDAKIAAVIGAAEALLQNAVKVKGKRVRQPYEYRVSEYLYDNLRFHLDKFNRKEETVAELIAARNRHWAESRCNSLDCYLCEVFSSRIYTATRKNKRPTLNEQQAAETLDTRE